MSTVEIAQADRAVRRVKKPQLERIGWRVNEWSAMTGTSRITTWRAIKSGALKAVDYNGIHIIPDSERVRLGFAAA